MKTKILGMAGTVISSDELSETQQPKQITGGIRRKGIIANVMGTMLGFTGHASVAQARAMQATAKPSKPDKGQKRSVKPKASGAANLKRAAKRRNNIRKHKG